MTASALTFLGAGDSQGVPRWWCDCPVCDEARTGGENARTRPSVLLEAGAARVLIDAAPEFRLQAGRAGLHGLEALLVTHVHNDHILGLGDVMEAARWAGAGTVVYAPPPVLGGLEDRFGYLFRGRLGDRFRPVPEGGIELFGWRARAFEVPHGQNGVAHALRLERAGRAWVYMPDAIGLSGDLERRWLAGLELLVLGASFWREEAPLERRSVHDVVEALGLADRVRPREVVLTHLGHGVDARRAAELPTNRRLARDGLRLGLW